MVCVDISVPQEQRVWKEVIPEDKEARLEDVSAVNGDTLAVVYKRNVRVVPHCVLHDILTKSYR